jgi:hypothetical protein
MSSALAMVLTAAMAVPGNGPERVSGEMEGRLDLSGEWEGFCFDASGRTYPAELGDGGLDLMAGKQWHWSIPLVNLIDEGDGKFHIPDVPRIQGIYRQHGDHLLLCFRIGSGERPTSFRGGDGQDFLILHRVKPRK